MKDLNLRLRAGTKPVYLRIADALREAICDGRVGSGEAVPSSRTLADAFGVHRHTARAALDELFAEGWLVGGEKRVFRAAEIGAQDGGGRHAGGVAPRRSPLRPVVTVGQDLVDDFGAKFDFRSGLADLRAFPLAEYQSHVRASLRHAGRTTLGYGDPQGHPRLILQLQTYLRRMRSLQGRGLVMTHGSQEAILLAAHSFIRPGDHVAVEAVGYPPALEAFRLAGAKLVPIAVDGEGMRTDELARRARAGKIAMIYTTPLHQYPTTVTMSATRRRELYKIAARGRIPIIEDDYDHELHYECQPLAPLASDDPKGLVIYVSSFSKVMLPSIRLGFLAVPPELTRHFVALRKLTTRQNDALVQETVARWMEDGGFERHLRRTRRLYRERRDAVAYEVEALAKVGRTRWSCDVPDGGMTLWLDVGEDSKKLAQRAAKVGIALDAEQRFRLDGAKGTHVRLGFARHTPAEAREGLRLLRRTT